MGWKNFLNETEKEQPGCGEERTRAELPQFKLTPEFFTQIDNFISENFAFRDQLVKVNAWKDVKILKSSFNKDVLVGQNGYLFLSETLSKTQITESELTGILMFLETFEAKAESCQTNPLFVFVPDKKSIYEDKLPARFANNTVTNYQPVIEQLQAANIKHVELETLLETAYQSQEVYSKIDTHWNRYGAYLAFAKTLEALNLTTAPSKSILEYERAGDLSRMLGLSESEITYEPDLDLSTIYYPEKVTLYYDSFGAGLIPFFEEVFPTINSYHIMGTNPLTEAENCWGDSEHVIIEIVERDITHLLNFTDKEH